MYLPLTSFIFRASFGLGLGIPCPYVFLTSLRFTRNSSGDAYGSGLVFRYTYFNHNDAFLTSLNGIALRQL